MASPSPPSQFTRICMLALLCTFFLPWWLEELDELDEKDVRRLAAANGAAAGYHLSRGVVEVYQ